MRLYDAFADICLHFATAGPLLLVLDDLQCNDELTLGFLDAATARKLDGIFEKYAARAEEIRLEVRSKRSRAHRLLDHAYYLVNELL